MYYVLVYYVCVQFQFPSTALCRQRCRMLHNSLTSEVAGFSWNVWCCQVDTLHCISALNTTSNLAVLYSDLISPSRAFPTTHMYHTFTVLWYCSIYVWMYMDDLTYYTLGFSTGVPLIFGFSILILQIGCWSVKNSLILVIRININTCQ